MHNQYQKYLGKYILIDIAFFDQKDEFIESFQTHGTIVEIDEYKGIFVEKGEGGIYILPPALDNLENANPGEYVSEAGDIITDPDFISNWEVTCLTSGDLEAFKNFGYIAQSN